MCIVSQNRIEILQLNNELFYKLKVQTTATEGLDDIEEQIVYEHIERSGNQGIWIRDIRNKTNLMLQPLNKILKSLESKQKIKSVKSVLVCVFYFILVTVFHTLDCCESAGRKKEGFHVVRHSS